MSLLKEQPFPKRPDYGDNVVRFFGKGCSFKDYARFSATESALETILPTTKQKPASISP